MTTEYKEVQVTQRVSIKHTCDKCGCEIPDYGDNILYDHISVSYDYSAWGDYWTEYAWEVEDLCLECCKDLRKLLIDNGYNVKIIEG